MTQSQPGFLPKDKKQEEFERLIFDVKYDKDQFKDPEAFGILLYRLAEERKATNQILSQINERLDRIGQSTPGTQKHSEEQVVSDVDEKIISHIQRNGRTDAEHIQNVFNYKGKNAASARLNALFEKGLLRKGRAGKKVLYWVPDAQT